MPKWWKSAHKQRICIFRVEGGGVAPPLTRPDQKQPPIHNERHMMIICAKMLSMLINWTAPILEAKLLPVGIFSSLRVKRVLVHRDF